MVDVATLQRENAEQRAQLAQLIAANAALTAEIARLTDRVTELLVVAQRRQRPPAPPPPPAPIPVPPVAAAAAQAFADRPSPPPMPKKTKPPAKPRRPT